MNKKDIYDKKIEVIKEFLKSDGSIDTLNEEQSKRSEILEQEYVDEKEEQKRK